MLRRLLGLLLLAAASLPASALTKYQNWCQQGGAKVHVSGLASSDTWQQSFPACTITVYLAGTITTATLASDSAGTPLSNPFTAASNGLYGFYVAQAHYDIVLSGGGLTTPLTLFDVVIADVSSGGGGSGIGVLVNGVPIAGTSANFSSTLTPPSNTINVGWQSDLFDPTHIDANVAYATGAAPGVIQLAGDLSGTATSPTVTSLHLAAPCSIAMGCTGQSSAPTAFNALAPASATGGVLAATATNTWGVIIPGTVGTCFVSNGPGVLPSYQACAALSGGVLNAIPKYTSASNIIASNLFETSTTITTTDTVDLSGAASFKVPIAAGCVPTASGLICYDSTANAFVAGVNGTTKTLATLGNLFLLNASNTISTGTQDFSAATHTKPVIVSTAAVIAALSCSPGELAFATDSTAGQNIWECPVATFIQQLNSGGGGAMATSASNAAAVVVPVDWSPSGTGAQSLGATAHPWGNLFLGNAATNNIKLTGTATGARTATLPDNTGTIAELNLTQAWTQPNTFAALFAASVTSVSANAATGGFLNLANADTLQVRNFGNSANITAFGVDSGNFILLGTLNAAGVKITSLLTGFTPGAALTFQPLANTGNGNGGNVTLAGGLASGTGNNSDVLLTPGTGGSGTAGIVQSLGALTFPLTNNNPTGTTQFKLASYDSTGKAIITPAGATSGLAGVCAENCTSSGTALIAKLGTFALNLDNTGVPGDYVCISATTAGFGHDCALLPTTETVGIVRSAVSGTVYNVDVLIGSPTTTSANALVTNPGATQTAQATLSTAISLRVDCPAGAAGSLACFQVRDNTAGNIFSALQNDTVQMGSGTGGSMTLTHVLGPTTPNATTSLIEVADTDCAVGWRNHANNGDINLCKTVNDLVTLGANLQAVQLALTGGVVDLTEVAAPSGAASHDLCWADSTEHAVMCNVNNVGVRQVASTARVRTVSGTTDTIAVTDNNGIVNYTSGSSIAVTVPQSTGQIANDFCFTVNASGAGTATLTPTTSTINGGASLAVATGKSARICTDGASNYLALLSITSAGAGDMIKNASNVMGGSGTLDGRSMSTTAGFWLPAGAGAGPTAAGVFAYNTTTNLACYGNGTTAQCFGATPVNVQNNPAADAYTVATGDRTKVITFSDANPVAVTLPNASASFPNGWYAFFQNRGAGAVTITPTTATVDGAASISLTTNQGIGIASDGTNYFTFDRGVASGLGDPGGNGIVVRTAANTTVNRLLAGTLNDIVISNADGTAGNPTLTTGTLVAYSQTCSSKFLAAVDHSATAGNCQTVTSAFVDSSINTATYATNPQTSTYQVLAADFSNLRTILVASGTFTITLVASGSQPTAGRYIDIINYGTGVVTVARSGQNINGATTSLTIPAAASSILPSSAHIVSDGTNYFAGTWFPATGTTGTGNVVLATSPTLVTPALGVATATSLNGLTVTTTTGTLTMTNGKTLAVTQTLTLSGTDSTVMTFPTTSATIARTDAANTFTGHQTIEGVTSTGATGTGLLVFGTSPTLTTAVLGSSTATTQSAKDNSTKVATTAYVDAATPLTTGTSVTLTAPRQYFVCTGTCTITVPVPAAGYEFCVMNDDNVATVITMSAIGSSARYENTARTAYGTAGTGTFVSGGAVGDKVCLLGRDSTHYLTASFTGVWTAN